VRRGNKAASQRVRTGTIMLERIAKVFRKESIYAEKIGKFRKKSIVKKSVKRSKSKKKIAIQIPLVKRKLLNHREHRGHREF
jgi:hypothetical protein